MIFWLIGSVFVLGILFKTPWMKGKVGEFTVNIATSLHLNKGEYVNIKNITLQLNDGSTTQIDHIIVSRYGVFVIETKNMKGWIFGDEHQSMWTQQIFKEKHRFQNPLRQNYRHTKALEEILALPPESIMSIVVFIGDCKVKTTMPKNVFINAKYTSYIESFQEEKLSAYQFDMTIETLNQKRLKQSFSTDREHVANLQERHNAKPARTSSTKTCSRCGKEMVLRHNRQTGKAFYGCSGYPKCRNVVKNAQLSKYSG